MRAVKFVYTFIFSWLFFSLFPEIKLPQPVSSNMMLQRDVPAKIWGWASPGEKITLTFLNEAYTTTADKSGNWAIILPAREAGVTGDITLKASNTKIINNVLFGDVWLCSGQSNMETPVSRLMVKYGEEINRYSNPLIRYIKIPLSYNFHQPLKDVPQCSWTDLTPASAQDFSGVAYFYARYLYEQTGIPQGIINSSVGGSPAEAWISEEYIKKFPVFENTKHIYESDEYVKEIQKFNSMLQQSWYDVADKQDCGINRSVKWYDPEYDFSDWDITHLPGSSWGHDGSRPLNGIFWFNKTVRLADTLENKEGMLYMGRIVDADSVYINGKFVGNTGYMYPPRNYAIPANVLKSGKNTVTVRLVSQRGFPEFVKDKPYKIVAGNEEISLEGEWMFKAGTVMPAMQGGGVTLQYQPAGLFNGMIAPLQNLAVKGFVWYQGEANTGYYDSYYDLMTALIANWREIWGAEKPFYFVQLANFMEPSVLQPFSSWAELRNVQLQIAKTVPNTGMAVAIELGEWNDIHPLNKKDVGIRLALHALKDLYGKQIVADGPLYESAKTEADKMIVSFREGTNNLRQVSELTGFTIAGEDGHFRTANAKIEGKTVVVRNSDIKNPKFVRYAWGDNPQGINLYNEEGLPASPFQAGMP
jgi:sialate O-acetylesterase